MQTDPPRILFMLCEHVSFTPTNTVFAVVVILHSIAIYRFAMYLSSILPL